MKERVTAGIIFHDGNKFLAIRPTDRDKWDVPKGRVEKGETALEAAIRETREETGIIVPASANFIDMGVRSYNKEKDINLFIYYGNLDFIDIKDCSCDSLFVDKNGVEKQEVEDYKFIPFDHRKGYKDRILRRSFGGNLLRVLGDIFEETNL